MIGSPLGKEFNIFWHKGGSPLLLIDAVEGKDQELAKGIGIDIAR